MLQGAPHRVWSKTSPSTKAVRDKILHDCIDSIRSKRQTSIFNRRMNDSDTKMELVDELINSSVQKHIQESEFYSDDYGQDILADIEFMSELENAIRQEMESEVLEYSEGLEEFNEYYEQPYDGVLCPVCRQLYLTHSPGSTVVACECGVCFGVQAGDGYLMESEELTDEHFLTEIRERISRMYDRHFEGCSLRSDLNFSNHRTLQFQCNNERLSGWCNYCGFCDTL